MLAVHSCDEISDEFSDLRVARVVFLLQGHDGQSGGGNLGG